MEQYKSEGHAVWDLYDEDGPRIIATCPRHEDAEDIAAGLNYADEAYERSLPSPSWAAH